MDKYIYIYFCIVFYKFSPLYLVGLVQELTGKENILEHLRTKGLDS